MEPRREEQKALESSAGRKPRRFRIVKLEERIAPAQGGKGTQNCGFTLKPHCPTMQVSCWCTWGCW
jgi:hypothetical protein